ncbi:MAG: hypothetical protein M1837_004768 [Sclerophora amabilis]|nr:MAG: hypothetical protein M1837_004768 [Sclerophora amabilis]
MRPPRLVVLLAGCIALPAFLLTLVSILSPASQHDASTATSSPSRGGRLKALFSFHSPSYLFPPSALISLTDDNSTFFLARPAAFGPLLPSKGFSGQLWVGSGFGDESSRRGGNSALGAEGELGCSDLPDWGENDRNHVVEKEAASNGGSSERAQDASDISTGDEGKPTNGDGDVKSDSVVDKGASDAYADVLPPSEDDGTDEHLRFPVPGSEYATSKSSNPNSQQDAKHAVNGPQQHADIQSLQESAEISGKIALLSRGGCGFLEKAKWVQRRGGKALIVGDDTRGGVLFTMYASGDTSNITIPSLFTSHTTAQLLSSLTSPTRYRGGGKTSAILNHGSVAKTKLGTSRQGGRKDNDPPQLPTFTPTRNTPKPTSRPAGNRRSGVNQEGGPIAAESPFPVKEKASLLHSILSKFGIRAESSSPSRLGEDSRRPPSSGQLDWVLVDEWNDDNFPRQLADEKSSSIQDKRESDKSELTAKSSAPIPSPHPPTNGDDFVIGVQDWRDPDLVGADPSKDASAVPKSMSPNSRYSTSDIKGSKAPPSSDANGKDPMRGIEKDHEGQGRNTFEGGSITPGSGEYDKPGRNPLKIDKPIPIDSSVSSTKGVDGSTRGQSRRKGWFGGLSWLHNEEIEGEPSPEPNIEGSPSSMIIETSSDAAEEAKMGANDHEGLWVTLTPTSMSTSPFFDTLLVLVVSPLVTLTVVYALLLLRSRIRRRRWRAPKAVVERLPVRTYHTLPSPSSPITGRFANSNTNSPSSPLLQASSSTSRPRPRSRTTSAVYTDAEVPRSRPITIPESPVMSEAEKLSVASSEWRRRYTGRQVECVVCLEEYVDGISKVMSLPCGHEFHVDCITPWLTTRRRTCPICKGDVVRSLAHVSSPGSPSARYRDDPENDIQTNVAEPRNGGVSRPILISEDQSDVINTDLEMGESDLHASFANPRPDDERPPRLAHRLLNLQSFRRLSSLVGRDGDEQGSQSERSR